MFYRPFTKSLDDLTVDDVAALKDREVPEGIALEYKRQWTPDKIARAIAAMANNVGGTLVVGMETTDLMPTNLCGFMTPGDPAEMVVQVVRDYITPIPDFRPLSLQLETGEKCLVVEVEEGASPPYLLSKTGQIIMRTPTSSAPATREEVQALFAKGERGRDWAEGQLTAMHTAMTGNGEVHLLTVPSVHRGLTLNPLLFRESVLAALDERVPTPFAHSGHGRRWDLKPDRSVIYVEFPEIHSVAMSVTTSAVVHTRWRPLSQLPDSNTAEALIREGLPRHARILKEVFGYRGSVFVAFGGHLAQGVGQIDHFHPWIWRGPLDLVALSEGDLQADMRREVNRTIGSPDYEPEP